MLAVVVGVGAADPCMAGGCDDCSGLAVACRGTSILTVPNLLHPDLRRLTLTSTSISVLSSASFSSYRKLLHLNLSSNAIEGLRDMPFRFQTDLVTFSLRGNRLASL